MYCFFFILRPLWSLSRGSIDLMSMYLFKGKMWILGFRNIVFTLTKETHRQLCRPQTQSKTDTRSLHQKHPQMLKMPWLLINLSRMILKMFFFVTWNFSVEFVSRAHGFVNSFFLGCFHHVYFFCDPKNEYDFSEGSEIF